MIEDSSARKYGSAGIVNIRWDLFYGEADAVVKGRSLPPGTMCSTPQSLLSWAREELGLRELAVRVLGDNPAIVFFRKCGFRETG